MTDPRSGMKAAPRRCTVCTKTFRPGIRAPQARYCSPHCIWIATKGPAFNAKIARESAAKRGDAQRGRGEGKSYRKLNGKHEHRAIAEQKLGRALAPGEIVHHDDDTKTNNAPANLIVLPSQSEHARLHFTGKKQSPEHIARRMETRRRTMDARK